MYIFHVYNGMMGVILLTVELIGLGSTASTYSSALSPHNDKGGAYTTVRRGGETQRAICGSLIIQKAQLFISEMWNNILR